MLPRPAVAAAAGAACIASASAFAPAVVGPAPRAGVCDMSMSAGTGKIKTLSAARAGVPRTQFDPKSLANYDASAALVRHHLPLTTRCSWVSPRTRWCDRLVASGYEP